MRLHLAMNGNISVENATFEWVTTVPFKPAAAMKDVERVGAS